MVALGFIISFPTIVEVEEENVLVAGATFLAPGDNRVNVIHTKHHDELPNTSKLNCAETRLNTEANEKSFQSDTSGISSFAETEQLNILDQKNEYLSSNLIETNSHLLILYEQMKSLEQRLLEKIEKEQQFLYQVITKPAIEHVKKTQQLISDQGQLSLDMIDFKKNIKTLQEEIQLISEKCKDMEADSSVTASSTSVPVLSLTPNSRGSRAKQNLLVAKCLFPTVVTVAAIVVNMYLYVMTTTKKFPI